MLQNVYKNTHEKKRSELLRKKKKIILRILVLIKIMVTIKSI